MRTPELPQPLLDVGSVVERPATDGAMAGLEADRGIQTFDVAAARGVVHVPGERLDDEPSCRYADGYGAPI